MQRQVTIEGQNKRRRTENESTVSRINRLERRIGRNKPDKQYYIFNGSTSSTTVAGTHEVKVSCLPNALLQRISGDFRIERVDYVVNWSANAQQIKTAVIQPYSIADAGDITSNVGDFIDPKEYRVSAERLSYTYNAINPLHHKSGSNLGHVVKVAEDSSGNLLVERNDTFLFLKYYQADSNACKMDYHVMVTFREK